LRDVGVRLQTAVRVEEAFDEIQTPHARCPFKIQACVTPGLEIRRPRDAH
jgi:hypothetical protein